MTPIKGGQGSGASNHPKHPCIATPVGPKRTCFIRRAPVNNVTPVIFDPLLPVLTSLFFAAVLFSDRTDRAELGQTAEAD